MTDHERVVMLTGVCARMGRRRLREGVNVRTGSSVLGPHRSCRAAVARHVDRAVARPVVRPIPTSAAISDPAADCGLRVLPTSLRHPKVGA